MRVLRVICGVVTVVGICSCFGCGPKEPLSVPESEAPRGAMRMGVQGAPSASGGQLTGAEAAEAKPQAE